jgi:hypothetical protein
MVNIGRKRKSQLNFLNDLSLSKIHAKLSMIGGNVYFEDMGSRYG